MRFSGCCLFVFFGHIMKKRTFHIYCTHTHRMILTFKSGWRCWRRNTRQKIVAELRTLNVSNQSTEYIHINALTHTCNRNRKKIQPNKQCRTIVLAKRNTHTYMHTHSDDDWSQALAFGCTNTPNPKRQECEKNPLEKITNSRSSSSKKNLYECIWFVKSFCAVRAECVENVMW